MNKIYLLIAICVAFAACSEVEKKADGSFELVKQPSALEVIANRTSVRSYDSRAVEPEKVERILRAGMAAPSAINRQPWELVVVNERAVLDSLTTMEHNANIIATAPMVIVVCGNSERFIEGRPAEYWVQDCSAVTENILLAATAEGLGSLWCGTYPMEDRMAEVSKALNLPENIIPMAMVVVGYANETPEPKDKWDANKVHYNRF